MLIRYITFLLFISLTCLPALATNCDGQGILSSLEPDTFSFFIEDPVELVSDTEGNIVRADNANFDSDGNIIISDDSFPGQPITVEIEVPTELRKKNAVAVNFKFNFMGNKKFPAMVIVKALNTDTSSAVDRFIVVEQKKNACHLDPDFGNVEAGNTTLVQFSELNLETDGFQVNFLQGEGDSIVSLNGPYEDDTVYQLVFYAQKDKGVADAKIKYELFVPLTSPSVSASFDVNALLSDVACVDDKNCSIFIDESKRNNVSSTTLKVTPKSFESDSICTVTTNDVDVKVEPPSKAVSSISKGEDFSVIRSQDSVNNFIDNKMTKTVDVNVNCENGSNDIAKLTTTSIIEDFNLTAESFLCDESNPKEHIFVEGPSSVGVFPNTDNSFRVKVKTCNFSIPPKPSCTHFAKLILPKALTKGLSREELKSILISERGVRIVPNKFADLNVNERGEFIVDGSVGNKLAHLLVSRNAEAKFRLAFLCRNSSGKKFIEKHFIDLVPKPSADMPEGEESTPFEDLCKVDFFSEDLGPVNKPPAVNILSITGTMIKKDEENIISVRFNTCHDVGAANCQVLARKNKILGKVRFTPQTIDSIRPGTEGTFTSTLSQSVVDKIIQRGKPVNLLLRLSCPFGDRRDFVNRLTLDEVTLQLTPSE